MHISVHTRITCATEFWLRFFLTKQCTKSAYRQLSITHKSHPFGTILLNKYMKSNKLLKKNVVTYLYHVRKIFTQINPINL